MGLDKDVINQLKENYKLIVSAAIIVLVMIIIISSSGNNIAGKAAYDPVQVYGEIIPELPDGTELSFKVGEVEIASALLLGSRYGYDPKVFFEMDDDSTGRKEGYAKGDVVSAYIENIKVVEFSYFEEAEKKIIIPASKRAAVSLKSAEAAEETCIPRWECSEWSSCIEGKQTRKCTDVMQCGTDRGKPAEKRSCQAEAPIERPTEEISAEKEAWKMPDLPWTIIAIIVLIFASLGIYAWTSERPGRRR